MTFEFNYICVKIITVIVIMLLYITITKYSSIRSFLYTNDNDNTNANANANGKNIETFEEQIEKEKYNYLKLKETYIDSNETSLELLYTNYYGEEVNKDVWEGKTFEQCIDTCNKLENCNGFSRDLVLDTEPARCYPITSINKCHSNRKGNAKQMSNALKYNSYVKSHIPNVINDCIGDKDLTLNRIIYIKSYSKPNHYIGNNGDSRVSMIDKNTSDFNLKCGFRIEQGKDGVGTISFLHLNTYKYLYRNTNNELILKVIASNKTEDEQRASFNIYDGLSNGIILKAMNIEGETINKYIIIDNTYLKIDRLTPDTKTSNENNNASDTSKSKITKSKELATFYIIDTIIDSKIITDKTNIPNSNLEPVSEIKENFTNTDTDTDTNKNKLVLDKNTDVGIYNKLFNVNENSNTNNNLNDYLEDNYLSKINNNKFISISKKNNERTLNKLLSNSLTKNQDEFMFINELNKEIEKEIANKNLNLNAKNDKIINHLDKIRITDLSKEYFFTQSLVENAKKNTTLKL